MKFLEDILELNKMAPEQLKQLCCALYALLQEHNVTVSCLPPALPGPVWQGGTSDPLPESGKVICTGNTAQDMCQAKRYVRIGCM